jgi:hypothetical protein
MVRLFRIGGVWHHDREGSCGVVATEDCEFNEDIPWTEAMKLVKWGKGSPCENCVWPRR